MSQTKFLVVQVIGGALFVVVFLYFWINTQFVAVRRFIKIKV